MSRRGRRSSPTRANGCGIQRLPMKAPITSLFVCQRFHRPPFTATRDSTAVAAINEIERRGIDAITKTRGRRSVRKNMPQVTVALGATNFRAHHPVTAILDFFDGILPNRSKVAGPTRSRIEFRLGIEERRGTTNACVLTIRLVIPEFTRKCPFGATTTRHLVLLRRKSVAVFCIGLATITHDVPRVAIIARRRFKFESSQARKFLLEVPVIGA